jgi:hypothetical protein
MFGGRKRHHHSDTSPTDEPSGAKFLIAGKLGLNRTGARVVLRASVGTALPDACPLAADPARLALVFLSHQNNDGADKMIKCERLGDEVHAR